MEAGIGRRLTESYAMIPAASVSGWYLAHPAATYFGVGRLGRDQVEDYATRKGWTVEEAERLAEVAQGVIVRHRENLGVQCKRAVNDQRWAEAARLGDTIISEFPNTQMAAEVRSMIDVLRTRATQAALAAQVK